MELSLLPQELIEEVAKYLSLDDIIACSAVNRQWRRAFDSDRIWKRFHTFHKKYFKKQVKKVRKSKYFFGGCKSKKRVFREMQVGKNLVNGKYDLVRVDIGRLYCDNLLDVVDDEGNHWLFVSCAKNYNFESCHLIEVWNMNDEPVKHQSKETPISVTKRLIDSHMKATKDRLYYMVNNILIAFEFKRPEYKLAVLFRVPNPNPLESIRGITSQTAMVIKPNMVLAFVFTWAHFVEAEVPWVHIWDEDITLLYKNYSDHQLDEIRESPKYNSNRPSSLDSTPFLEVRDGGISSDNVLLVYKVVRQGVIVLSVDLFNLKTRQYSSLLARTDNERVQLIYCEFVSEVVVVFYYRLNRQSEGGNMRVPTLFCCSSDRRWSYEPQVTSGGNNPYYNVTTANEGKQVLVLDSCGEITVFDVFEQREISRFRITYNENIGTYIKKNVLIVREQQINKTTQSVWDFKSGKYLYAFDELQSLSHETDNYKFSFIKSYSSPPKIFAIKDPQYYYSRQCNGEILIISFC